MSTYTHEIHLKIDLEDKQLQAVVDKINELQGKTIKTKLDDGGSFQKLAKVVENIGSGLIAMSIATREAQRAFRLLANTKLGRTIDSIGSQISSAFLPSVSESIDAGFTRYDIFKTFSESQKIYGTAASKADKIIEDLNESVLGLPTSLDEIMASYSQIRPFVNSEDYAAQLTKAINYANVASTADETAVYTANRQLRNLLAGTKLTQRQWDSLRRGFPELWKVAAKNNKEANGSVKKYFKMLDDGAISTKQLFKDIIAASDGSVEYGLQNIIEAQKKTVSALRANVRNAFSRLTKDLIKEFDSFFMDFYGKDTVDFIKKTLIPAIDGLSKVIVNFVENNKDRLKSVLDTVMGLDWNGLINGILEGLVTKLETMVSIASYFNEKIGFEKIGYLVAQAGLLSNIFGAISTTLGTIGGIIRAISKYMFALSVAKFSGIRGSLVGILNILKAISTLSINIGTTGVIGAILVGLGYVFKKTYDYEKDYLSATDDLHKSFGELEKDSTKTKERIDYLTDSLTRNRREFSTDELKEYAKELGELTGYEFEFNAETGLMKIIGAEVDLTRAQFTSLVDHALEEHKRLLNGAKIQEVDAKIQDVNAELDEHLAEYGLSRQEASNLFNVNRVLEENGYSPEVLEWFDEYTRLIRDKNLVLQEGIQLDDKYQDDLDRLNEKLRTYVEYDKKLREGQKGGVFDLLAGREGLDVENATKFYDIMKLLADLDLSNVNINDLDEDIQVALDQLEQLTGKKIVLGVDEEGQGKFYDALSGAEVDFDNFIKKFKSGIASTREELDSMIEYYTTNINELSALEATTLLAQISESASVLGVSIADQLSPPIKQSATQAMKEGTEQGAEQGSEIGIAKGARKGASRGRRIISVELSKNPFYIGVDVTAKKASELVAKIQEILTSGDYTIPVELGTIRYRKGNNGQGGGEPPEGGQYENRGGLIYASTGRYIAMRPRGTDIVPAMLTPGEFVQRRAAVRKFGTQFMSRINSLDLNGALNSLPRATIGNITNNRDNHATVVQNIYNGGQQYTFRRANRFIRGI